MKLIANLMLANHVAIAAEALAFAASMDLDLEQVVNVIGRSPASSTMFQIRAPQMINGTYSPAPGPANTMSKYLEWIESNATDANLNPGVFSTSRAIYNQAISQELGGQYIAVAFKVASESDGK